MRQFAQGDPREAEEVAGRAFQPERRYTEKHINQMLSRFHPDTASLRRCPIRYKLLARDADGVHYWRRI